MTQTDREALIASIDEITNDVLPPACDMTGCGSQVRAKMQVEIANRILSIPAIAEALGQAEALERAYGALWLIVTIDKRIHHARNTLRDIIGKDGMRRGIAWAAENLPPPTESDIARIDA